MKIGYQGVPGSYSEMTLRDYVATEYGHLNSTEITAIGYSSFEEVLDALDKEDIALAVLPIENSTTGIITPVVDLIRHRRSIMAIAERYQPVEHTLWAIEGTSVEDIEQVYSHPEALSQCDDFFSKHTHLTPIAFEDTAKATAYVAENQKKNWGALASQRAGEIYGLTALAEKVQTEKSNTTRFYIFKKVKAEDRFKGDLLTFYIETSHEPGALAKLLQAFVVLDCNLEALNARPIPNKPFDYGFYLEVKIDRMQVSQEVMEQIINHLSKYTQLLGQFYPVIKPE